MPKVPSSAGGGSPPRGHLAVLKLGGPGPHSWGSLGIYFLISAPEDLSPLLVEKAPGRRPENWALVPVRALIRGLAGPLIPPVKNEVLDQTTPVALEGSEGARGKPEGPQGRQREGTLAKTRGLRGTGAGAGGVQHRGGVHREARTGRRAQRVRAKRRQLLGAREEGTRRP